MSDRKEKETMKMNELNEPSSKLQLRALTDGQPSHGILEMIDWIPHIKKLGMNAVYFSIRIFIQ